MEALPKRVQNRVLSKAVRSGLKPVLSAARANAPKSPGKKKKGTKQLRKEIKIRVLKSRRNSRRKAAAVSWKKINEPSDVFYGYFQEFGWKKGRRFNKTFRRNTTRKIKRRVGTDTRTRQPGLAFIGRAARAHGRQSQAILVDLIRGGILKEAAAL